jgi:hypothetical protein
MALLADLASRWRRGFPERLAARIALAGIASDSASTDRLALLAFRKIEALALAGADWFATLGPRPRIDPETPATVVILDGASPDVFIEAAGALADFEHPCAITWHALGSAPRTVDSLLALFGFAPDRDPIEEFALREIEYTTLAGDEARSLDQLLPAARPDRPRVLRIALLDRRAHAATAALADMPRLLDAWFERHLEPLVDACRATRRPLVVTTDHGLTLSRRGLSHGKGGIFEEAIFRLEWAP